MANEIKIKIKAENDSKAAFSEVKGSLHDVETASDKAGNKLTAFSKRTSDVKSDLKRLDEGIAISRKSLETLASAFANTDDAAQRMDIKKAIQRVQSDLTTSLRVRKIKLNELIDLDSSEDEGRKAGEGLLKGLGESLTSSAPRVASLAGNQVGLIVGASAAAAIGPTLLSAVGAALSAGTGAAVIGAGVMTAVKNSDEIKNAGKELGKNLLEPLKKDSEVFIGPVLNIIDDLGTRGQRMEEKLGGAFKTLSGELEPLTDKVLDAGEAIGNVLIGKAEASGPALDALGDGVKQVGNAAASFLNDVIDTGPEAASNLRLVLGATSDLITQTGNFLGLIRDIGQNEYLSGALLPLLREHYDDAADSAGTFAKRTAGAKDEMTGAAGAAKDEAAALQGLNDQLKAQVDPVFALKKAQRELKDAQKEYSEAVKDSGKNSRDAKEKLEALTEAGLNLQGATAGLGNTFSGKLTPEMKNALRVAGLTEDQINGVEKEFKQAKKAGDSYAKKYAASVALNGYRDANGKLSGLLRDLESFDGVWTATMITNYVQRGKPASGAAGGHQGYAHGGITGAASGAMSSDMTWVGENGPELLDLPPGTRVLSNSDSRRMTANGEGGSGQGGGGGTLTLKIDARPQLDRTLVGVLIEALQLEISHRYGGDPIRALGRVGA